MIFKRSHCSFARIIISFAFIYTHTRNDYLEFLFSSRFEILPYLFFHFFLFHHLMRLRSPAIFARRINDSFWRLSLSFCPIFLYTKNTPSRLYETIERYHFVYTWIIPWVVWLWRYGKHKSESCFPFPCPDQWYWAMYCYWIDRF